MALRMLCEKLGNENRLNLSQSVGWLVRAGAIERNISRLIYEVIKIANRGVHEESVSSEYVEFVEKVYPEIIKIIENKVKNLSYMVCDRCKYRGFTAKEDFGPRCGYTSYE